MNLPVYFEDEHTYCIRKEKEWHPKHLTLITRFIDKNILPYSLESYAAYFLLD
jgi:hypothetical protein